MAGETNYAGAYVHSNLYNFGKAAFTGDGTPPTVNGESTFKRLIAQSVTVLRNRAAESSVLEQNFMGPFTPNEYREWSQTVLLNGLNSGKNKKSKWTRAARLAYLRTINDPLVYRALGQPNISINTSLLNNESNEILTPLLEKIKEDINSGTTFNNIAKNLATELRKATTGKGKTGVNSIGDNLKDKYLQELWGIIDKKELKSVAIKNLTSTVQRALLSRHGTIFERVEVKMTPSQFYEIFNHHFKTIAEQNGLLTSEEKESFKIKEESLSSIYTFLFGEEGKPSQFISETVAVALGKLGEDGIQKLLNCDLTAKKNGQNLSINFNTKSKKAKIDTGAKVVGDQSEKAVRNELDTIATEGINRLKDVNKMSYSDIVLTSKDGDKTRVQSKNYLGTLQAIEKRAQNTGGMLWMKLGGENKNLSDFISGYETAMSGTEAAADANELKLFIENIKYGLVNDLWFFTLKQPSISVGSSKTIRDSVSKTVTSMAQQVQAVEKFIGDLLFQAMGVTFTKSVQTGVQKIESLTSNLFYLVGNTTIVPTSVILGHLADGLEALNPNSMARFLPSFTTSSTTKASALAAEKRKAMQNDKNPAAPYTPDGPVYEKGAKVGSELLNNAVIKNIKLGLHTQLLTSAFNIEI